MEALQVGETSRIYSTFMNCGRDCVVSRRFEDEKQALGRKVNGPTRPIGHPPQIRD